MTKGIEANERTAIELSVYMRTLNFLTTYDQVSVPALAGAENILLRVAPVIKAYRSDLRRPNWASVKHIAAIDDAFDPVPTSAIVQCDAHRRGGRGRELAPQDARAEADWRRGR